MAQQLGIVNFRGSIGDMTYVKTEDGYHVRRKSSLDKARVLKDKRFGNSRKASKEFAAAAHAGKLLRQAILGTLKNAGDAKMHSRMLQKMLEIIKTDPVSNAGKRIPDLGILSKLRGFEFNNKNELIHTLLVQYRPSIDRATGLASVEFPAFEPGEELLIPDGATHFKLLTAVAKLDFKMNRSATAAAESEYFSVKADTANAFSLSQNFTDAQNLPIVLVLGIRFYRFLNGNYFQLHANDFNAVRIVAVDQI